jgi:hypothetical protein
MAQVASILYMGPKITVNPCEGGWAVASEVLNNEMYFLSGAVAETSACALGVRLAASDSLVVVEVFARDGSLAGRHFCSAAAASA